MFDKERNLVIGSGVRAFRLDQVGDVKIGALRVKPFILLGENNRVNAELQLPPALQVHVIMRREVKSLHAKSTNVLYYIEIVGRKHMAGQLSRSSNWMRSEHAWEIAHCNQTGIRRGRPKVLNAVRITPPLIGVAIFCSSVRK